MESNHSRRSVLQATGTAMLATALAGCSGDDGDGTSTEQETLQIDEFVYCAERPRGWNDYEAQPDATYAPTDTIWVYLDVLNVGTEEASSDTVAVDLVETLTVTDPSGETVLEQEFTYDDEFQESLDMDTFYLVHDITMPSDAATGEYEVTSSLEDRLTDETTERTEPFTIE